MAKRITNRRLLDELNKMDRWFHARKKRPIWAKVLKSLETIETLEGTTSVQKGDFLCRGEAGEVWPQSPNSLLAKYEPTKIIDGDGFRLFRPARSEPGVMAARMNHSFEIQTKRGKLQGKRGDFVLKSFEDRETPYPAAVRIVDAKVFRKTYERVR